MPAYDVDAYVEERLYAEVGDIRLPITVVRHVDTPLDGTAPCLLYGYGAYEACFEPEFDAALTALLDHGVVWAHAGIRGGGEGGRRWWLDGHLEHKQNTFSDQIAAADFLADGLVDGTRIVTRGLSAGGLLQGAVFSQAPQRWAGVIAEVPAVDILTTMLDPSIPLTINEWDEWGDPRKPDEYQWLLAYSPYDNLPDAGVRPGPAGDRSPARPAGDGVGAGEVGRRAARDRSRLVAPLPLPGRARRRVRTSVRPGARATCATRPRSTPGRWTASDSLGDLI